jgi:acyl-CoA synthetase (AMP-forming)/AMP-acid ligase II
MLNFSCGRELFKRYSQLAEEQPNEYALIIERKPYAGTKMTWADLLQRSEDLARKLHGRGIANGARCAVTLTDHPDTLPLLLALWRLDATAVLIDRLWGARRRDGVIEHGGATHAVTLESVLDISTLDRVTQAARHELPTGTAMLGYTSGSTGDPKGVAFVHDKLALTMRAASAAIASYRGSAPRRIACSMRLSGSGVLNLHFTWAAFSSATTVVLPELTIESARDYWARIADFGIEQTFLVPPLIELLNHVAQPRAKNAPAPICLTGSAPLSARTQERFQQKFELPLLNAYGLSETMCASFFGQIGTDGRATNSIGLPWLLEARIKTSDGELVPDVGEGELELTGPTIFDGYYGNAAATAESFDGRWFRTGDIVRRDHTGRFHIVGRRKDVVMKGGFSVYFNEVEEAALALNGVLEAAVVPVVLAQGEDMGLIVRVERDSQITADEVLRFVREDIGAHRAPYRVVKIDSGLPRTGQDKLDRKEIILLWNSLTRETSSTIL